MKKTFIVVLGMIIASQSWAFTICETFDQNPATNGWTTSIEGTSVYTYNANGYMNLEKICRSNNTGAGTTDRLFKSLDKTYTRGTFTEAWMQFDARQLVTQTDPSYYINQGRIGIFNSNYDNSDPIANTNSVATMLPFWTSGTNFGVVRLNTYMNATSTGASAVTNVATPAALGIENLYADLRYKTHIYFKANGELWGEIGVYFVDRQGNEQLFSQTVAGGARLMASTQSFAQGGMDIFGISNNNAAPNDSLFQNFYVDNLYFSTDSAAGLVDGPSWIPEPATMSILALGGLYLARRKA